MSIDFWRPSIYFFTEPDKLDTQPSREAYGPISDTRYRLTSIHSASSDPKAIAVMDGMVFVQKNTNGTYNIIQRPARQSVSHLPNIGWLIYKGIRYDSLFQSKIIDGETHELIADETVSDLTNKMWFYDHAFWEEDRKYDVAEEEVPEYIGPKADFLLDPFVSSDDEAIREFFHDFDEVRIQPYLVHAGDHIGNFDASGFGFEIILESWEFTPVMGDVRTFEHIFEVPSVGLSSTEAEKQLHWLKKERIRYFMDPAAFFGSFYRKGLDYYMGGTVEKDNGDRLFARIIGKLHNRNVVYIDLRNALGWSMNAFGDFGNDIKFKIGESGSTRTTDFRSDDWPQIRLTYRDFALTYYFGSIQKLRLQLPIGDYEIPRVHLQCDWKPNPVEDEFERIGSVLELGREGSWTKEFHVEIPQYTAEGWSDTPVSTYFGMTYQTLYYYPDNEIFEEKFHITKHYLDLLFVPFQISVPKPAMEVTEEIKVDVYTDHRFLSNQYHLDVDFTCARGVARGKDVVTFFAYPLQRVVKPSSGARAPALSVIPGNYPHSDLPRHISNVYDSVILNSGYVDLDADGTFPYIRLRQIQAETDHLLMDPDISELIMVNIGDAEYDAMETLATTSGFWDGFPIYLGVKESSFGSVDGEWYQRLDLWLKGMEETSDGYIYKEVDTSVSLTFLTPR